MNLLIINILDFLLLFDLTTFYLSKSNLLYFQILHLKNYFYCYFSLLELFPYKFGAKIRKTPHHRLIKIVTTDVIIRL